MSFWKNIFGGRSSKAAQADAPCPEKSALRLLNEAIKDGSVTESMIKDCANLSSDETYEWHALIAAAWAKDDAAIRWILECGVDTNEKDHNGRTALHYAYSAEIVQILIDAGATMDEPDNEGATPLIVLCDNENGSERVKESDEAAMKLIELSCDWEFEDKNEFSALDTAAYRGRHELVEFFLQSLRPDAITATSALVEAETDHPSGPEAVQGRKLVVDLLEEYLETA